MRRVRLLPQLAAEANGQVPSGADKGQWPGFFGSDLLSGDAVAAADLAQAVAARVRAEGDPAALVPRLRIAVGCHPP